MSNMYDDSLPVAFYDRHLDSKVFYKIGKPNTSLLF